MGQCHYKQSSIPTLLSALEHNVLVGASDGSYKVDLNDGSFSFVFADCTDLSINMYGGH